MPAVRDWASRTHARADRAARQNIPIHTVLVGNERPRDVSVSVVSEAPFAFTNDPVLMRVHIEQRGFADEAVTITLLDGDRILQTRDVVLPAGDEPIVERFEIQPQREGKMRYRAEITPLPGELTVNNNSAVTDVHVVAQPIRLLYVEHWPRWQYQFLRNALRRDHRFAPHLVLLTEDPATPIEDTLGALDQCCPLGVPVDPSMPLEQQHLARDEIRNQQADPRIQLDIAQGVEEAVAGKIGKRQAAIGIHVQKA